MKKTFVLLGFVLVLAAAATIADANSALVLRGEIPFDFYVENRMLPAGEYHFEMGRVSGTSGITVRASDGRIVALVPARLEIRDDVAPGQFSFNTREGKHFLASIECFGYKAELRKQIN